MSPRHDHRIHTSAAEPGRERSPSGTDATRDAGPRRSSAGQGQSCQDAHLSDSCRLTALGPQEDDLGPGTRREPGAHATEREVTAIRRALFVVFVLGFLLLLALSALAGALRPGDFVMVTSNISGAGYRIVALDVGTLAVTEIATNGYVGWPDDIVVDRQGSILITSPPWGVVRINPSDGQQTLIAPVGSLGGGTPTGLTVAAGGEIYVSMQGAVPRILRLSADGSVAGVVTSGGFLTAPEGLAFGADSALYVCETLSPNISTLARGALVRVDPGSGSQVQFAVGVPLNRPHDLAVAPDGSLWSIGYGIFNGHLRYLVRTSVPDAVSTLMLGRGWAAGIAIRSDGVTVVGDCDPVHTDCEYPFTMVYPSGPYLGAFNGLLAVVPDVVTRTTPASWGRIKALYR